VATSIVFETHSWSEDNDRGLATGWLPGRLSERGRELARELGDRRRDDGIEAVFCSDLGRATETAELAFAGHDVPRLFDWRLRECDYGSMNGRPATEVHGFVRSIDDRYPDGESWREAVGRAERFLADLPTRWDERRVLIIGHMAVYWALEHTCAGMPIEQVGRGFTWQEGWEYELDVRPERRGRDRRGGSRRP
jgi:2,3-bisphosphoglycerate-dependent phosphoglycerate mutase